MNNLVRELKSMNWVWSRGTDRLFGWQHDLELRALLEEVRPVSFPISITFLPFYVLCPCLLPSFKLEVHDVFALWIVYRTSR
jgi:hypothetical protein|eukprot:COSAG02_NODE_9254_length_2277_cov_1.516070_1_plen_82_part_00